MGITERDFNDWTGRLRLIEELASDDAEFRRNAMRRLQIHGDDEVVPYLVGCLMEYSPGVADAAGRALSAIGDDTAVFHLVDRLSDQDASWAAARAIGKIYDPRPIVLHIQDLVHRPADFYESYDSRYDAAVTLGKLGDVRAVPALIFALRDVEGNVRREAISSLGLLGDDRAVGPLSGIVEDAWDDRDRRRAVGALAAIGSDAAWLVLIDKLPYLPYLAHPWAYPEALRVLVQAGERRAIPQLLKMIEDGVPACALTARALRDLGHTDLLHRMLIELESAEPWSRETAAEALGGYGDDRAVEPLIAALKDIDPEVRRAAARGLGQLGDYRSVQPLIRALDDSDRFVRLAAIRSLGQLGDDRATPYLAALEKDDDREFQHTARRSMKALENSRGRVSGPCPTYQLWL